MTPAGAEFVPVSARLQLRFLDYRIAVHTNSLRLGAKLQSYFAPYLDDARDSPDARLDAIVGRAKYDAGRMELWSGPPSPNRLPKESFYDDDGVRYILKNRTGLLIVLADPKSASVVGDLEANANQVFNVIGTLFGQSLVRRGYLMLHASAVVETATQRALAFLGNSGSGKSSLALQLIERGGYEFVSNDRILLKSDADGVLVVGLPTKPRVNPGTLLASAALSRLVSRPRRRAYEQLPADELWQLEEKTDVDVEQDLGARSTISARLAHIYSLDWRRNDQGMQQRTLDVQGAIAAMTATAKDFGPYDVSGRGGRQTSEMKRVAELVACTKVTGKADPRGFVQRFHSVAAKSN